MRIDLVLIVTLLFAGVADAPAQDRGSPDAGDVRYYDAWPGAWHRIDGERVEPVPTFVVRRGPGHSFLEDWYLEIDGKRAPSFGLRSWDPESRTWRLVWVSDPGLFQIWDGIRHPDGWYIVRRFGEGPGAFLSRQAWIPQGPDRMLRTIERSTDDGKTWTVRYRDVFTRVSPAAP